MGIYSSSRYIKTSAYPRRNETLILGIRSRFKYNPEHFKYHTVVSGDTLDGIAYRYYNNAHLYWAILDANPKYQSEIDIAIGDVISIPDYSEVVMLLG